MLRNINLKQFKLHTSIFSCFEAKLRKFFNQMEFLCLRAALSKKIREGERLCFKFPVIMKQGDTPDTEWIIFHMWSNLYSVYPHFCVPGSSTF